MRGPRWWRRLRTTVIVTAWLIRRGCRGVRWSCRHPVAAAAGALALFTLYALLRYGWLPVALVAIGAAGIALMVLGSWAEKSPATFTRYVGAPTRSAWRRTWNYRRRWHPATHTAGLTLTEEGKRHHPQLGRVRAGDHFDTVRVKMLPGQVVTDWSRAGEQLAQTLNLDHVRAYPVPRRVQHVELRCLVNDPLLETIPALRTVGAVDLSAVPVGMREDGGALTLPANRHLLIAGETGAGKSSALWSLVCGVAPAINAGLLRVRALDPKRMELAPGLYLWDGYCRTGGEQAVAFLEDAVRLMQERQDRLTDVTRDHTPTVEEPLYVILVDEVAALTAWIEDPKLKRRAIAALSLLLSQGRAAGFFVWMAAQDPRKETLTVRDLVTFRVALRTAEADQADLILGRGARERGAWTDRIDAKLGRGVCYVVEDGVPEPVRARFAHVTDADIARVVKMYPRPLRPAEAAAGARRAA